MTLPSQIIETTATRMDLNFTTWQRQGVEQIASEVAWYAWKEATNDDSDDNYAEFMKWYNKQYK